MRFLRRHDRYVLQSFWGTFAAILLFFTVITVVAHMADRSNRLARNFDALRESGYEPYLVVAEYYATLVPFLWQQIIPLGAVLAAAFGLSRLTRHNELGPLVASGVSTRRLTLPLVLSAVIISGALFAVQELLVPKASRRNMLLDRLLTKYEPDRIPRIPHFDDPGGARLSVAALQPSVRRLEEAHLTFRDEDGFVRELRFYPLIEWRAEDASWVAVRGGTRLPLAEDETGRTREAIPPGEVTPLEADVRLLEVTVLEDLALGLSSSETAALLEADPDNTRLILLHHRTISSSLAPLVLLLIGLPFCLRLGGRSALPGTIAVLAGGGVYFGLSFLCSRLATSGELNPTVMAWLPTVLVGSVGLPLWLTMRS